MFEALQRIMHTKSGLQPGLLLVSSSAVLLRRERRAKYTAEIRSMTDFSKEKYEQFVAPLINNVAEFVQDLPETEHSYYNDIGGLLDHTLNRTVNAMTMLIKIKSSLVKQPELWTYAVICAGLLYNIGQVAVKITVTLCDQDGTAKQHWLPYEGSMVGKNTHYKYEFEKANRDDLRRRVNLVLARQLIPEDGFNWLATNKDILAALLAILNEDDRGGGFLSRIIPFAEGQSLAIFISEQEREGQHRTHREGRFKTTEETDKQKLKTEIKEVNQAFIEWLDENIKEGHYNKANSFLHETPEGLFVEHPRALQKFVLENPKHGDSKTVFKRIQAITRRAADGSETHHYLMKASQYDKGAAASLPKSFLDKAEQSKTQTGDAKLATNIRTTVKEGLIMQRLPLRVEVSGYVVAPLTYHTIPQQAQMSLAQANPKLAAQLDANSKPTPPARK